MNKYSDINPLFGDSATASLRKYSQSDGPSLIDYQFSGMPSSSTKDSSDETAGTSTVRIDRSVLDQGTFDSLYREDVQRGPAPDQLTLVEKARRQIERSCTFDGLGRFVVRRFPCLDWLRHYDIKNYLVADIVAGLTIAVFQVPQGMAYAMLANVPPVYGLYTSFFPVLVYALMGTSRQASIGTFAITSLMTGVLVDRYSNPSLPELNSTRNANDSISGAEDEPDVLEGLSPIQVATAVAMVCGLLQIIYGILRLGSLAVFLSEHLVSGFTCGSAIHVLSSQVKTIFGVSLKASDSGFFGLVHLYVEFFSVIHKSNPVTLALSASTLAILIFFKEFVNLKTKKWTPVPFPIELVLVVASTFASNYLYLRDEHNVRIVGHIEQGFPAPSWPPTETLFKVAAGSVALSIVGFSSTVSLGKIFAAKYNYEIDPNQDTIALGTANIVGSLFSCIPSSASISRSSVQDGAGAKTQLVSLINCAGLLVVLLALGSLLEPLPNCVLSCVIVVSLKGMVLLSKDFLVYWKRSKVDGAIWMVTFLAVLFLDVDLGLGVGLGFALLTLIYRTVQPRHQLLGRVPETELFVSLDGFRATREVPGAKIAHFGGPLHFANADFFAEKIKKLVKSESRTDKASYSTLKGLDNDQFIGSSLNSVLEKRSDESSGPPSLSSVILDCSAMAYVDLAGLKTLKTVYQDLDKLGIRLYMAACSERTLSMIQQDEFFSEKQSICFFPSLTDAVTKHLASSRR